jgi:hypothetical protein
MKWWIGTFNEKTSRGVAFPNLQKL